MAINFSIGRTLWFHFNSSLQVNKVCRCSRFLKSNKDFWFHGSFELTVEDLSDKLQMALSPFFFCLRLHFSMWFHMKLRGEKIFSQYFEPMRLQEPQWPVGLTAHLTVVVTMSRRTF